MRDTLTFDEDFLRRLELLRLVVRRLRASGQEGQRAGRRRGGRVEFADHRRYTAGDDWRYIDWPLYARLEKLFLKEFVREEDQLVYVLLDESLSMAAGEPPKRRHAARLAAALAGVALAGGNRARVGRLADGTASWSGVFTGDGAIFPVLDFLSRPPGGRGTDLAGSLAGFYREARRPVLGFLISDLFDAGAPGRLLQFLSAKGFDLAVIHLLAPEEFAPPWRGKVRLLDRETGESLELSLGRLERERYGQALEEFLAQWRSFCLRHDVRYLAVNSALPLEELVLRCLREEGLLR